MEDNSGEPCLLIQTPKEQVFSNHVIMQNICKYLNTSDLLHASLVSVDWCAKSRYALINQKHEVCIKIKGSKSPCRQLVKLNSFLGQTRESHLQAVIYNGIHLVFDHDYQSGGTADQKKCCTCLMNDWVVQSNNVLETLTDAGEEKIMFEKILKCFGHILNRIRMKYLILEHMFSLTCPFARLLKFVLQERTHDVLKLDFGYFHENFTRTLIPHLLLDGVEQSCRTYVNLEILGIKNFMDKEWMPWMSRLPVVAPKLKKLKYFNYNPNDARCRSFVEFPHHAVTVIGPIMPCEEDIIVTLNYIKMYQPSVDSISVLWNPKLKKHLSSSIFEFGNFLTDSLRSLTCGLMFLTYLVCRSSPFDSKITDNRFSLINGLTLTLNSNTVAIKTFNNVNFFCHFPNLATVTICFFGQEDIFPLSLTRFFVDDIFEETHSFVNKQTKIVYPDSSIRINNKSLKRLRIFGNSICTRTRNNDEPNLTSQGGPFHRFLVPNRLAEAISKYLPGLTIELKVRNSCKPICSHFEHLMPYSRIAYLLSLTDIAIIF